MSKNANTQKFIFKNKYSFDALFFLIIIMSSGLLSAQEQAKNKKEILKHSSELYEKYINEGSDPQSDEKLLDKYLELLKSKEEYKVLKAEYPIKALIERRERAQRSNEKLYRKFVESSDHIPKEKLINLYSVLIPFYSFLDNYHFIFEYARKSFNDLNHQISFIEKLNVAFEGRLNNKNYILDWPSYRKQRDIMIIKEKKNLTENKKIKKIEKIKNTNYRKKTLNTLKNFKEDLEDIINLFMENAKDDKNKKLKNLQTSINENVKKIEKIISKQK